MTAPAFATGDHCHQVLGDDACATNGTGGIDVGVGNEGGGSNGGPGVDVGVGSGSDGPTYEYRWVLTCPTNTATGINEPCTQALTSCPDTGDIRYWVFRRVVHANGSTGPWEQLAGSFCRGPDPTGAPRTDGRDIQDAFKWEFVPIVASRVRVEPDETLVNVATVFSARTRDELTPRVRILGHTVRLTLHPSEWTWHFGDGSEPLVTQSAGAPYPSTDITHRYRSRGRFDAYVTVTWGGTFSFAGQTFTIPGTTSRAGPATSVVVRPAHTHLVSGDK
jgi:hypothetical protein